LEDNAIQSQSLARLHEALGADVDVGVVLQPEQVEVPGKGGGVQYGELWEGVVQAATAGTGRLRAEGEAVGVQAAHGEEFQLEQLG
jgi:hypothetical protein